MDTHLKLVMEQQFGKTQISDCYFTAPLKVGVPRMEGGSLKVVLMMASAGMLKGDHYIYDIICKERTRTELTEQSYTKIFDSGDGKTSKKMSIRVEKNAVFYYHPSAVIPFGNSYFDSVSEIWLDKNAEFLYSDIFACGRVAMGEKFAFHHYCNKITVYVDQKPAYLEHNFFEPQNQKLCSMYYFDGFTHQGSLYYYSADKSKLEYMYNIPFGQYNRKEAVEALKTINLQGQIVFGVSKAREGIIFKVLANHAQDIEEIFQNLRKRINII